MHTGTFTKIEERLKLEKNKTRNLYDFFKTKNDKLAEKWQDERKELKLWWAVNYGNVTKKYTGKTNGRLELL